MSTPHYEDFERLVKKHGDTSAALYSMVEAQPQNKLKADQEERLVQRAAKAIRAADGDSDLITDILVGMVHIVRNGDQDRKTITKFYAELAASLDIQRTPKELTLDPFFSKRMELFSKSDDITSQALTGLFMRVSKEEQMNKGMFEPPLTKGFGGRLTPRFPKAAKLALAAPKEVVEAVPNRPVTPPPLINRA